MLASVWFFLWGLLWAVYFMLDGFDLGAGSLMPFVAKTPQERRQILVVGGPFWDGNEVWLIAAGGVTFAAFPAVYAAMFSGLYTALMLLLFAIIIRAVSFELRDKLDTPGWLKVWDTLHFVGSALPPILLGVAFANIFRGLPIDQDGQMHSTLLSLLNPYGLAGGVLFFCMFLMHGAIWLAARTGGVVHDRSAAAAIRIWPALVLVTLAFLAMTAISTQLLANYLQNPLLFVVLLLAVVCLIGMRPLLGQRKYGLAFGASALFIVSVAFFGIIGLYPALLPSSLNPAWSLTAANGSSSELTLKIMLGVVIVFVPIVLLYQAWVYKTFTHKVTVENIEEHLGY